MFQKHAFDKDPVLWQCGGIFNNDWYIQFSVKSVIVFSLHKMIMENKVVAETETMTTLQSITCFTSEVISTI